MSGSDFPDFEVVDDSGVGGEKFSLVRPKRLPEGISPEEFAEEIREEVCQKCNDSGNVRTCLGIGFRKGDVSARIAKEDGQVANCLLLLKSLENFVPKRRVRVPM